ncbi:MAG: Hemerythrin cation binding domain protein [Dehalococcoidia bacterium]|nr:Hemerythrin cation binding domain protein [Dehalococcoidia bacterium]
MNNQRRPTDILSEDHKEVLAKLSKMGETLASIDKKPDLESLKEYGKFFKRDIWAHFDKEEKALFPEMEKFIPRDQGPIGVMLLEHKDLREANDKFQSALAALLQDVNNAGAKQIIRHEGYTIIDVLQQHIHKEDNILFMMANMHINDAQNKRILEVFAGIDREYGK